MCLWPDSAQRTTYVQEQPWQCPQRCSSLLILLRVTLANAPTVARDEVLCWSQDCVTQTDHGLTDHWRRDQIKEFSAARASDGRAPPNSYS